uniref:Uncharacterized protein n=1 Tax=Sphaerodactylus townsendi TaxID=933632 RepID=A0ACB8E7V9_9SAUR
MVPGALLSSLPPAEGAKLNQLPELPVLPSSTAEGKTGSPRSSRGWLSLLLPAGGEKLSWLPGLPVLSFLAGEGRTGSTCLPESTEDAIKNEFYEQLQDVFANIPNHHLKLLTGDFSDLLVISMTYSVTY